MVPHSGDILTIGNSVLTDTIPILLIVKEDIDKIANDNKIYCIINQYIIINTKALIKINLLLF
jgi:hypothetical protein